MAIRRSPGCNCCGSTPEPCECCVDTDLKPPPVKTGTSFTDTTWDADWVGVDDKTVNTLPANTHAYIDINVPCPTRYVFEVEVIDFGVDTGAKIWIDGMQAENYRTATADGDALVVAVSSGLSYGIAAAPSLFGGDRYVAIILDSGFNVGGAQTYNVSMQDTSSKRIDDGENFFPSYPAHSAWVGAQEPIGPTTIRLNIQSDSSEIKIGQVRMRYGWTGCSINTGAHSGGDNTTFCFASKGMSLVNSGAASLTCTETSTGVTHDSLGGCTLPDPRPCGTWVNTLETDYTPLNGTFEYELERQTNFWESETPVYESANWTLVTDWVDAVKNWTWTGGVQPISFWEYSQVEPQVEVTLGNYTWDNSWANWTFGSDVCGEIPITFNPSIPPLGANECPAFAENYNAPVAVTTARQGTALDCLAVNVCSVTDVVHPAMTHGVTPCIDNNSQGRWGIVFSSDPSVVLSDFVVPAINLSVDQDSSGNDDCFSGNWSYTVVRGGFTMTRTKDCRVESFDDFAIGAKPASWVLKGGTVTNFAAEDKNASTTASQNGNSYVPQTLTFISGSDQNASDCNPDDVYKLTDPSYGEESWACGVTKSSPWLRVDTDDGDSWDISIDYQGISAIYVVTARRYSDCETVVFSDSLSNLPADKCETHSVSYSNSDFDISFTWKIA